MKIALAHFRVGETDGVSLEMEKWKIVLEQLGHEVMFLAGSKGEAEEVYVINELHYQHPDNNRFVSNCYDELKDYETPTQLKEDILSFAKTIETKLVQMIDAENIDLLIPNNIWSLGWGLPAGIGFTNAVKKTGVQVIAHHHDFSWERVRYSKPTYEFVHDWLQEFFPPNLPQVTHVVINRIAQKELKERRNIESFVVPNVFNFAEQPWGIDDYNKDFKAAIGLKENDLYILQATRIDDRKAIELGIDVVAELQKPANLEKLQQMGLYDGRPFDQDSKIIYVLAGLPEASAKYVEELKTLASEKQVELRFVNDMIESQRTEIKGKKCYSLWDAYVYADLITYPSILEGWGNQLLEAVYAKKPMVVYEYPVYVTDLKETGFKFASLGDSYQVKENGLVSVSDEKIQEAAAECLKTLIDSKYRNITTNHNFDIAKKYFSYTALQDCLKNLLIQNKGLTSDNETVNI